MTGPSATEADEKPGFLDRMRARLVERAGNRADDTQEQ